MRMTRGLQWLWVIGLIIGFQELDIGGVGRSAFIMAGILISLFIFRRFARRHIFWLWIPLTPMLWWSWNGLVLPSATLHSPKNAQQELGYHWNVQNRTYKGVLPPGASTSDEGFLFPDDDFFMQVDWWRGRIDGCAIVTPTWKGTNIYLDETGDFDRSEGNLTDWEHLARCPNGGPVTP